MDTTFEENELLLRAVLPTDMYWVNGKLSSAAFKDRRGLSVDRTGDRSLSDAVKYIKSNFNNRRIVSVTVPLCRSIDAYLKYLPTSNKYHSEIHGSETNVVLSNRQARQLANNAKIEQE